MTLAASHLYGEEADPPEGGRTDPDRPGQGRELPDGQDAQGPAVLPGSRHEGLLRPHAGDVGLLQGGGAGGHAAQAVWPVRGHVGEDGGTSGTTGKV